MTIQERQANINASDRFEDASAGRFVMINPGVSSHFFEGELLLFSEDNQTLYSLNQSAGFVWCCCEDGLSESQIAEAMAEVFRIPVHRAVQDVSGLLKEWASQGLLAGDATDGRALSGPEVASQDEEITPESHAAELVDPVCCLRFELAGAGFLIRFASEEHRQWVAPVFEHLKSGTDSIHATLDLVETTSGFDLLRDGALLAACTPPDRVAPVLGQEVLRIAYKSHNYLIAVHAAVAARGDECVVFPGLSGNGKTTLSAALMHAGFRYFTDEVAIIERGAHRVVPIPVALRVKEGAWPVIAPLFPGFDQRPFNVLIDGTRMRFLNPGIGSFPVNPEERSSVRALVFPNYSPEEKTTISPMSRIGALRALQDAGHDMGEHLDAERVTELLAWIGGVDCYEMKVNDLSHAVSIVSGLLE
jgi:hypothetical protein